MATIATMLYGYEFWAARYAQVKDISSISAKVDMDVQVLGLRR